MSIHTKAPFKGNQRTSNVRLTNMIFNSTTKDVCEMHPPPSKDHIC